MLETLVTVVHIVVALFMILVVLLQGGNQGGMGAAFGGGNSSGVFGATGATTLLGKITYVAAAIFMVTSVWLTIIKGASGTDGLTEAVKERAAATESTAPATEDDATAPVAEDGAAPATEGNSETESQP